MPVRRQHVLRDPLHGYVPVDDLDRALIDTPIVQRLRYIRQNDVAYLVFPAMNTSRFEHSLGVMHIAGQLAEFALSNSQPGQKDEYCRPLGELLEKVAAKPVGTLEDSFIRAARWYGLLHDVGHLPFSHLTEHAINKLHLKIYPDTPFEKLHESAGREVVARNEALRHALSADPAALYLVTELMTAKKAAPLLRPLKDIVDSDTDADRIDSTARDGRSAGGDLGNYDIPKLVRDARLVRIEPAWRVLFSTHAISTIESMLVERCKTHKWVHYHPMVVNLKNVFRVCIDALEKPPEYWHATRYARDDGYLDDAEVFKAIGAMEPRKAWMGLARGTVLRREKHVVSLWKLRDEYRALAVAAAPPNPDKVADPVARMFNLSKDVQGLEDALNTEAMKLEGLESVRFLVAKTSLKPFEQSGSLVVAHRDGRPINITDESALVKSLQDVVGREPPFGVTVVGPREVLLARKADLQEVFVAAARGILESLEKKSFT